MKLKEINLSLFILTGLLLLSFSFFVAAQNDSMADNIFMDSDQDGLSDEEERSYGTDPRNPDTDADGYSDGVEVASGYSPLVAAPADRLTEEESAKAESAANEENLTEKMAKEITEAATNPDFQSGEISIDDIQTMIDSALNSEDAQIVLPEISRRELNIKSQNYGNLSSEKALEKEKEDLVNYMIAIYYILASNSPEPVTSASDITSIVSGFSLKLMAAITMRNTDSLKEVASSGERMLEQMMEVEVPEKLADLHIKGLSLAQYAILIKDDLAPKSDDPLGEIVGISKIQNYMGLLADYSLEVVQKFTQYGISYTDEIKDKIESFGLVAPDEGELPVEE